MASTPPPNHKPTRLKLLQQRISIVTWCITLILSLRGLFAFYGMKDKGFIEQIISFVTEPLVQLFRFERIESLEIPGISILFATIAILLLGQLAQFSVWLVNLRLARARALIYQHAALRSNQQT